MIISLIAAVDSNFTIGNQGKLPWPKIKRDMQYFRQQTVGKPIILGRKTFESLTAPLPQRFHIILTQSRNFAVHHKECAVVHSVREALIKAKERLANEVMVIGGAKIYELFLPLADRLYITFIAWKFEGDAKFPPFEFYGPLQEWQEDIDRRILVERDDAETQFDLCFSVFERIYDKRAPNLKLN